MAEDTKTAAGGVALLIIDVINSFDFPGAETLLPAAEKAADAILKLRDEARALGVPVIYVNDNYGQWLSERNRLVEEFSKPDAPGHELVRKLAPSEDDLFIVKPRFSGFYATNLPVVAPQLKADRLVLTGWATDICVMFTAADAHMRDYRLWIPKDAVAGEHEERSAWAFEIMENSMGAETRKTSELSLKDWLGQKDSGGGA